MVLPSEIPTTYLSRPGGWISLFWSSREDITIKVVAWKENLEKRDNFIEVWVQMRKLLPKWCEWSSLDQITSVFGLLVEVDWQQMFKSMFEVVRVKIQCRDPNKIPNERLFSLEGKLVQG